MEINERFYPGQIEPPYIGKVRKVSTIEGAGLLVAETTNNLSAFDYVLPEKIPLKGAILNLMSEHSFRKTKNVARNCLIDVPHPRFSIWRQGTPFQCEFIVRGYNTGSFYRDYSSQRIDNPWGYKISPSIKKNEAFPYPLVTPTTKAEQGEHDEPISARDIVARGLASQRHYTKLHLMALRLFARGQKLAEEKGLILVDTKYEFAIVNGTIILIDEVHTPDSSRYWYRANYEVNLLSGKEPEQLSKEFVREWLMQQGFKGEEGQAPPALPSEFISDITQRYCELYKRMTGEALTTTIKKRGWAEDWEEDEEEAYRLVSASLEKHANSPLIYP